MEAPGLIGASTPPDCVGEDNACVGGGEGGGGGGDAGQERGELTDAAKLRVE